MTKTEEIVVVFLNHILEQRKKTTICWGFFCIFAIIRSATSQRRAHRLWLVFRKHSNPMWNAPHLQHYDRQYQQKQESQSSSRSHDRQLMRQYDELDPNLMLWSSKSEKRSCGNAVVNGELKYPVTKRRNPRCDQQILPILTPHCWHSNPPVWDHFYSSINRQEIGTKMKRFCCCLASTHLFLRIQHVLLFVIINVHCTFKLNGATVACKSFKNFHVLQKWQHLSYWCNRGVLVNAKLTLLLASARSLRSLKCTTPDSSISVGESCFRTKVSHVMDVQLFSCVQNWKTGRLQFQQKLKQRASHCKCCTYLRMHLGLFLTLSFVLLRKRKGHDHCREYCRPHSVPAVWWPTPSYLPHRDAIVDHFKAVFEFGWDGQAHVDGELFET